MHGDIPVDWNYKRTDSSIQVTLTDATHGRIDIYEKGTLLIKATQGDKLLPLVKAHQTAAARNSREKEKKGVKREHHVVEVKT